MQLHMIEIALKTTSCRGELSGRKWCPVS